VLHVLDMTPRARGSSSRPRRETSELDRLRARRGGVS